MTSKLSQKFNAARARKRLAGAAPDYPARPDFTRPLWEIIVANRMTGATHFLQLFHSRRRADAFRVTRDGAPWRDCIGSARLGRGLARAISLRRA
jgi:hypothetical protein